MDTARLWPVALVTGASSGIGAAFARRLAAGGSDLVLVARRVDRLDALATELEASHGTKVEVLAADLTDPGQLAAVEDRLGDQLRRVDLLVNNAGVGSHGALATMDLEEIDNQVRLNLMAPVRLLRAVLPGMMERGRGAVVNVSSISGEQPMPYVAMYSATKAFVTTVSESVHEEARRHGVTVTVVLPGFTRTEFHDRPGMARSLPGPLWIKADVVVEAALWAAARGKAVCVPTARYRALVRLSRVAPRGLVRRVTGFFTRLS